MKKALQCLENACIMNVAVTLIAMKREVAAPKEGGFSVERMSRGQNDLQTWRQVTVQIYRKFLRERRYAAGRKSVEPESGRNVSRKETHW